MRPLFAVIAGLGTLFLLRAIVRRLPSIWRSIRYRGSDNWPKVEGTVESQVAKHFISANGTQYRPCLSYSYSFQGEYYAGTYKGNLYLTEDTVQSVLDRYPAGSILTIRVSPKNPAKSVPYLSE